MVLPATDPDMVGAQALWLTVAAAAASALLTWLAIRQAARLGALDTPDARRMHATVTPRGGGVGIAVVMGVVLAGWPLPSPWPAWPLVSALAVAALVGGWDDLRPLPAAAKLAGQVVAAGLLAMAATSAWGALGGLSAFALALVAMNAWNFIDGSNGMAATQGLVLAMAVAAVAHGPLSLWALALAGACLGFLPFNFPAARVFLGDVGSHALGMSVAIVLLAAVWTGVLDSASALLLGSAPLLDTGWTLFVRIMRGEAVWRAHNEHLYQLAIRNGHGHRRVCLAYGAWTAALAVWVVALENSGLETPSWSAVLVGALGSVLYFSLRRRWRGVLEAAGSQS